MEKFIRQKLEAERKRQADIRQKICLLENAIGSGSLDARNRAELARLKSQL